MGGCWNDDMFVPRLNGCFEPFVSIATHQTNSGIVYKPAIGKQFEWIPKLYTYKIAYKKPFQRI